VVQPKMASQKPLKSQLTSEVLRRNVIANGRAVPSTIVEADRQALHNPNPARSRWRTTRSAAMQPCIHRRCGRACGPLQRRPSVQVKDLRPELSADRRTQIDAPAGCSYSLKETRMGEPVKRIAKTAVMDPHRAAS
jgi:hypothetical protein